MATGPSKNILLSKTFWGVVIAVAAPVLSRYGFEIEPGTEESLAQEIVSVGGAAIGGILAIYGRLTAKKGVTIL